MASEVASTSGSSGWREAVRIAALFRHARGVARPERLYEYLSTQCTLAESSMYLNLGLWDDGVTTYDGACAALARHLGEAARLMPGQRVLDVGCGFGEQDLSWLARHELAEVVGVNVSAHQLRIGRERVAARGVGDRIRFVEANAVRLPFPDASFDAVVGLESAFHFDTRERFFAEAYRVLRPGGVLGLADIVYDRTQRVSWVKRALVEHVGCKFWQVPPANLCSAADYRRQLVALGFAVEHWESIAPRVYAPFRAFARRRLTDPEIRRRVHPVLRALMRVSRRVMRGDASMDYIIARARKP